MTKYLTHINPIEYRKEEFTIQEFEAYGITLEMAGTLRISDQWSWSIAGTATASDYTTTLYTSNVSTGVRTSDTGILSGSYSHSDPREFRLHLDVLGDLKTEQDETIVLTINSYTFLESIDEEFDVNRSYYDHYELEITIVIEGDSKVGIFTEKADEVNFAALSSKQRKALNKNPNADIYDALGKDDIVYLPTKEKSGITSEISWDFGKKFEGGKGHDEIYGANGNDKISGGVGSDILNGGQGSDIIDGIAVTKDGAVDTNSIVGGPVRDYKSTTDFDIVAYSGHFSDYNIQVTSFKETFTAGKAKTVVTNGEDSDVLDGGVEQLTFAGKAVKFSDLEAFAGFKWAMESAGKLLGLAEKYADFVDSIPKEAKSALAFISFIRQASVYAFEKKIDPEAARSIYQELSVGLVRTVQNYTDKAVPASSFITGKYYDALAEQVHTDAGKTFDIFSNEGTRPSLKEVGTAFKLMWNEAVGLTTDTVSAETGIPDMKADHKDSFDINSKPPEVRFGSDGNDIIDLSNKKIALPASEMDKAASDNGAAFDYVHMIYAGGGYDRVNGSDSNDFISGDAGKDQLRGNGGNDKLSGGEGSDRITGGRGIDELVGGGGADIFIIQSVADAPVKGVRHDTIADFTSVGGDRIDLSTIDANWSLAKNQAFEFIGEQAFSGKAGELRYSIENGNALVQGDANGDGKGDFAILLLGLTIVEGNDFIL